MASHLDLAARNPQNDGGIVFDHVPLDMQYEYLVALLYHAIWLGAMGLDVIQHIGFDYRLAMLPGWSQPRRAVTRIAYFLSRYLGFAFCLVVVYFLISQSNHCNAMVKTFLSLLILSYNCSLFIFLMRTLALWEGNRLVFWLLLLLYFVNVGLSITLPAKNVGSTIPLSNYCFFSVGEKDIVPYVLFAGILDGVNLGFTSWKLLEGGMWKWYLGRLFGRAPQAIDVVDSSVHKFSRTLVEKGVLYFIFMEIVSLVVVIQFFTAHSIMYKVMNAIALVVTASCCAGNIYRSTFKVIRQSAALEREAQAAAAAAAAAAAKEADEESMYPYGDNQEMTIPRQPVSRRPSRDGASSLYSRSGAAYKVEGYNGGLVAIDLAKEDHARRSGSPINSSGGSGGGGTISRRKMSNTSLDAAAYPPFPAPTRALTDDYGNPTRQMGGGGPSMQPIPGGSIRERDMDALPTPSYDSHADAALLGGNYHHSSSTSPVVGGGGGGGFYYGAANTTLVHSALAAAPAPAPSGWRRGLAGITSGSEGPSSRDRERGRERERERDNGPNLGAPRPSISSFHTNSDPISEAPAHPTSLGGKKARR